jgi:hypothetical protein
MHRNRRSMALEIPCIMQALRNTPMTRISPTDYYQIIHELLPKYVVAQQMLDVAQ